MKNGLRKTKGEERKTEIRNGKLLEISFGRPNFNDDLGSRKISRAFYALDFFSECLSYIKLAGYNPRLSSKAISILRKMYKNSLRNAFLSFLNRQLAKTIIKELEEGSDSLLKNYSNANFIYWEKRLERVGFKLFKKIIFKIIVIPIAIFNLSFIYHQNTPSPPTKVLQVYYEALNARDIDLALSKWGLPINKNKFQKLITNLEWFQTNNITLIEQSNFSATVWVDVRGKQVKRKPESWVGNVSLIYINGWKITKMNLRKIQPF